MAIAIGASLFTFTKLEGGSVEYEEPTAEQERRKLAARGALVESIIGFLSRRDLRAADRVRPTLDERGAFGFFVGQSAERFAVCHEFGHLLAGHQPAPKQMNVRQQRTEYLRREYEADHLGGLLLLRGIGQSTDPLWRGNAVAGPFLLLAVHHLVMRVKREVYGVTDESTTHPPSDKRAAALRGVFVELVDPGLLQLGDTLVSFISDMEDELVEAARQIV